MPEESGRGMDDTRMTDEGHERLGDPIKTSMLDAAAILGRSLQSAVHR